MKIPFAKTANVALVAGVAALAAVAPADAAFVVIVADPVYGPEFPNLGWRAEGLMFVPDACRNAVSQQTVTLFMAQDAVCAGAQLQDVKLHFYDVRDPGRATLETLNIGTYTEDSGSMAYGFDVTQELIDISFSNDQVVAFHSSLSFPLLANHALAGGGNNRFSLEFSAENPPVILSAQASQTNQGPLNVVRLGSRLVDFGPSGTVVRSDSSPAVVTIGSFVQAVPEPGSFALTLAALAAALMAGLASRRSRN